MINLFQHQQQALDETEGKNRVAYYLDMGLGKTFVGSEKMMKLDKRINLVVCQCSKVQDWIEHFQDHYAKQGYVGTVGGINIYTKKNAETGKVVIATKEAVTLFNKKGTEVEQEREGNIRRNTVYSRKYYLAAMTNEAKAVMIITGSAAVTTDETVTTSKTYYAKSGIGYVKVTPGKNDNPKTKGWYEITAA